VFAGRDPLGSQRAECAAVVERVVHEQPPAAGRVVAALAPADPETTAGRLHLPIANGVERQVQLRRDGRGRNHTGSRNPHDPRHVRWHLIGQLHRAISQVGRRDPLHAAIGPFSERTDAASGPDSSFECVAASPIDQGAAALGESVALMADAHPVLALIRRHRRPDERLGISSHGHAVGHLHPATTARVDPLGRARGTGLPAADLAAVHVGCHRHELTAG